MNNLQVHFAALPDAKRLAALHAAGVRNILLSAYNFIKNKSPDRIEPLTESSGFDKHLFDFPVDSFILDSGLFTLLFGAGKGKPQTYESMRDWMHRLVRFVEVNNIRGKIVEVDAQDMIGSEARWDIYTEMRELLPNHEIVTVTHISDGLSEYERLCDASDSIAISVPQLRIHQSGRYKTTVRELLRIAHNIKPDIKIHLLGCTELDMIHEHRFDATTCDSSSFSACDYSGTYGTCIKQMPVYHKNGRKASRINHITSERRAEAQSAITQTWEQHTGTEIGTVGSIVHTYLSARMLLPTYEQAAGPQNKRKPT